MARPKVKDSIKVNFNLDRELVKRMKELAEFEGLTQSNFIEILILKWDEGINPESKLNTLLQNRNLKDVELSKIDIDIKKVSDQITLFNDLKRQKLRKKPEALKIIEQRLLNDDMVGAERVARSWQKNTGIPAFELLLEASNNIKDKGI